LGKLNFLSAPICAKAISNRPPDAVSNLTATVTDSGIELKGKASALAKTFELFRKERESDDPFEKIRESNKLPILDTSALYNTKAYCYKVSYRDVCGNQSTQSDTVCPILLTLNPVGETTKNFSWTSFEGWKGNVEGYELIRTPPSDAPQILDMETRLSYKSTERDPVRQKIFYQIKARPTNSTLYPEGSFSNKVENIQNSKLKFPEVFTPNNDGNNDTFRCYSLFVSNYELRIYNAWGNIIFASQTLSDGWSGTINSKPAPSGSYAYWATGTDQEGNVIETKGFFTLAR
jgi:gliding motility-associated-like protein